jgi:hypothetical protein
MAEQCASRLIQVLSGCHPPTKNILITADHLDAAAKRAPSYSFPHPTICPPGWRLAARCGIDQTNYVRRFGSHFPKIQEMLCDINAERTRVVVAGGAALLPYNEDGGCGDIDMFIIASSDEELFETVVDIRTRIGAGPTLLMSNVITIVRQNELPCQIIVRRFPEVVSILDSFDIGMCQVCFDGKQTMLTESAAFAVTHRVATLDVVFKDFRGNARVAKYFSRGFAIAIPNLDVGKVGGAGRLRLPYIEVIDLKPTCGYFLAARSLATVSRPEPCRTPFSAAPPASNADDAIYRNTPVNPSIVVEKASMDLYNLLAFVAGESLFIDASENLADILRGRPRVCDVLRREDVEQVLNKVIGDPTPFELRHTLGMTDEEVKAWALARVSIEMRYPRVKISHRKSLEPFRTRILQALDAADYPIQSSTTQAYVIEKSPTRVGPQEWLGEMYCTPSGAPLLTESVLGYVSSLPGLETCPLCLVDLLPGERGTVILNCGHCMHLGNGECGGYAQLGQSSAKCPMCRRNLDWTGDGAQQTDVDEVEVELELGAY